jgi:hypothetical protein
VLICNKKRPQPLAAQQREEQYHQHQQQQQHRDQPPKRIKLIELGESSKSHRRINSRVKGR